MNMPDEIFMTEDDYLRVATTKRHASSYTRTDLVQAERDRLLACISDLGAHLEPEFHYNMRKKHADIIALATKGKTDENKNP